MPRFTIGMPTYKRCDLLRQSLNSALGQSASDYEIVVSDDASPDATEEVVRSFGERVRYHRNEQNIGMWPNFVRALELAQGEYFSWLQDDDLIHRDFVRRALESFARAPDIVYYAAFALHDHSPTSVHWSPVVGPMFELDWMGGSVSLLDGPAVAPLLHIINIATFPNVAFRTDALRRAVSHLLPDCDLFNENILMAALLTEGRLAVDPWIAAFHRAHEHQVSRVMERNRDDQRRQWRLLAAFFERFLPQLPDDWEDRFQDTVRTISVPNRIHLLNWATTCAGDWGTTPATARRVRDLTIQTIPRQERHRVPSWVTAEWSRMKKIRQRLKKVTPPAIQRLIHAARG